MQSGNVQAEASVLGNKSVPAANGTTPLRRYGLGVARGMLLVLRHIVRPTLTTQYPWQRLAISKRTRGPELVWVPVKCTGCSTCAKACPQGNIVVVTSRGEGNNYNIDKFEVDIGRCKSCGLCVEACPFEALYMSQRYELAQYQRRKLVQGKEEVRLSDSKQPSAYAKPWLESNLPAQSLLVYGQKKAKK